MVNVLERPVEGVPEPEGAGPGASPEGAPAPAGAPVAEGHRGALAALLGAAGVVHLVMAPSHVDMSAVEGAGFFVAGWVQVGLAAALARRADRGLLGLSVVVNAALLATWALSRTAGLPFGDNAGHAESVSFVDGSVVALEVLAIVAALALLARRRLPLPAAGGLALVAPLAALALATGAIASPDALDHAAGAHGEHAAGEAGGGHGHGGEAAADDRGLSLLSNGHQHETGIVEVDAETQAALDEELALTQTLIDRYPTLADAEAAGYWRGGPFVPGLGTHYVGPNPMGNTDGDIDAADMEGAILIYDGLEPDSPLAGFMFQAPGDEAPEGFTGPNDHWHYHERVCIVPDAAGGIDTPFGADANDVTREMCDGVGGQFIENTGYMVHVWNVPGYESERGMFGEINPAITCPQGDYYVLPTEEWADTDTACLNP